MKILWKILKTCGILLAAILSLMVVTPLFFKDKIKEEVKNLANKSLNAEVNFGDMSVSFFSHFPHLTLTLKDFVLKGSAPFEKDTLLSAREMALGVNIASLFDSAIRVNRVYLDRALVSILYNDKGETNYDVMESSDSTAVADTGDAGSARLRIEKITFSDSRLVYSDASLPLRVEAKGLDYSGKSDLTGDIFDVTSEIRISALDLVYDKMTLLESKPVTAKMTTRVNTRDLTIDFQKNDLNIKDIPLQFNGKFNFEKDGYLLNLTFLSVMEKEFLSARFKIRQGSRMWLFAKANASVDLEKWARAFELKNMTLKGFYDLNLLLDGYYETGVLKRGFREVPDTVVTSIPKFELMTSLREGYFKLASLPSAMEHIGFSMNAACPDSNYENIHVELENLKLEFLKNSVSGYFKLLSMKDMPVDVSLKTSVNLAEIKNVIPLDSLEIGGQLEIDATIRGKYSPDKKLFPVSTVTFTLANGLAHTTMYPNPVKNINLTAKVTNTTGEIKDTRIVVNPASLEFEGKPFNMEAAIENPLDVGYAVKAKGVLDLGKIYKVFAISGMDMDGYLAADLSLKGKQSDAVAGRVERLHNSGKLEIRNISFTSESFPKPFIISSGNFRFDQDKVWFDNFLARYGSSDFRMKGYLLNTIRYILSQGGTLRGNFELESKVVNADEFMVFAPADGSKTSASTAPSGVVIIPRDLDIDFKAGIGQVLFNGLDIRDLKGEIDLKGGILVISRAGFSLAGCKVAMDATYGDITPDKAHFDFKVKAEEFDIKRAYNEIALIRELATSAGKAEGIVSLDYTLKGRLNAEMYPVLPSLEGGGTLSVKKVKVSGLKLFNDISKSTDREGLANPDLSKVDIKSVIKNNVITLEQFKFKVSGLRLRISGTTTLDSKLDLRIRIGLPPLGLFGIPLKVTGTADNIKIRYGRGKDSEDIPDSEYSDELPPEMLQRIKNARDDSGEEEGPEGK